MCLHDYCVKSLRQSVCGSVILKRSTGNPSQTPVLFGGDESTRSEIDKRENPVSDKTLTTEPVSFSSPSHRVPCRWLREMPTVQSAVTVSNLSW
jgi:hypothetical protein